MEEKNAALLEEATDTAQPSELTEPEGEAGISTIEESAPTSELTPENESVNTVEGAPRVDYAEVVRSDLEALRREFPELGTLSSVTELDNPLRYAALRDLGLSAREAYLATAHRQVRTDNRSHLYSTPPRATGGGSMPEAELSAAREIFGDLSDSEIRKLYKKVTA